MIDLVGVVSTTSFQATGTPVSLPLPFMIVFSAFNRVHHLWRWYKRAEIYSNPNNFLALAAGHAVNALAGDKIPVKLPVLCVLVAQRILMVVDQTFRMQECFRKLKNAFRDEYSKTYSYKVVKNENKYHLKRTTEKIKRIVTSLLLIFKEAFILSMRMIDAIEIFYMNPDTMNDGVGEVFVNAKQVLEKLERDKKELQNALINSKPVIEKVLKAIGSPFNANDFIDISSDALDKAAVISKISNETTGPVAMVIQEIGKRFIFGVASMVGLKKMVPKTLYPDYSVKPREVHPSLRFAAASLITIVGIETK